MGDQSEDDYHLLLVKEEEEEEEDEFGCCVVNKTSTSFLKSSARLILKVVMWVIFIAWVAFIFLYPTDFMTPLYDNWIQATTPTVLGPIGGEFMVFGAPILIIAFLAIVRLIISGDEEIHERKISKNSRSRLRLWTFPVLVHGPLGVVSAGEMIGIVLFFVYILWTISLYTMKHYNIVLSLSQASFKEKSLLMLEYTGLRLGFIGLICLGFLFLPVARGSILLRVIGIPFEHAVRYHVWLGHLTLFFFTIHGLCFVIEWTIQGRLMEELREWKNTDFANFPGVISFVAGLLMWVTSLPGVRRVNFELFFYTHQLYVVFVVFLALHVGAFIFSIAAAGIFIYMLDRFLRFCQSRTTVDVLSIRCFPCGTLEIVLSKPPNLRYNALSWSFLQIRELSLLQWHPFSVCSSPLDGKHHMAFLVKVLGGWTAKLKDHIISSVSEKQSQADSKLRITTYVEGPYGHESPYHLEYENLILVAGGIGISPFLAILSDVLHRLADGRPCLPKNILIVWAIKNSDELPLLKTVDLEAICPSFSDKLNLEIQTYVTRESQPSLEEAGKVQKQYVASYVMPATTSKGCGMSVLVGTGSVVWSGLYVMVSTVGWMIFLALLNTLYICPYNVTYWWYKGLLFMACMAAGVVVFGGGVIGLWHLWGIKGSVKVPDEEDSDKLLTYLQQNGQNRNETSSGQEQRANFIRYGQRPDFGEIFGMMSARWGNVDVGVIVCGPASLESSVAQECRKRNFSRSSNEPILHFHKHSFDL